MADRSEHHIKKILMTTDTVGGIWTYAMELANQLSHLGVDVHLATMGQKMSAAQKKEASGIARLRVYESTFKLEWMTDPWVEVEKAGEWLLELEQKIGPDVVHLNSYSFASLPFAAPKVVVCHSCVFSWYEQVKKQAPEQEKWQEYFKSVANGLHDADEVIAITHSYAARIAATYHLPLRKINVIYNGIDIQAYHQSKKNNIVLGIGRIWDEAKNYKIAEKFATQVDWDIKILGNTTHPDTGSTCTIENVMMPGQLPKSRVKQELASAAIYFLPALYEPFGLSALEAAASGCALVLADIPTLRELWDNHALFVKPDDDRGWSQAINCLIDDAVLRAEMSRKAVLRAQNFTIGKMAERYVKFYNEMIKSKTVYI